MGCSNPEPEGKDDGDEGPRKFNRKVHYYRRGAMANKDGHNKKQGIPEHPDARRRKRRGGKQRS